MVLQTSCRCLRQVDKNTLETAVIWLNDYNAQKLNAQLREEQHTSIDEINKLGKKLTEELVARYSRIDYLRLPQVDFYQLSVNYNTLIVENQIDTKNKLSLIIKNNDLFNTVVITQRGLDPNNIYARDVVHVEVGEKIDFNLWLFSIQKGSFNSISLEQLYEHKIILRELFDWITVGIDGETFCNDLFDLG